MHSYFNCLIQIFSFCDSTEKKEVSSSGKVREFFDTLKHRMFFFFFLKQKDPREINSNPLCPNETLCSDRQIKTHICTDIMDLNLQKPTKPASYNFLTISLTKADSTRDESSNKIPSGKASMHLLTKELHSRFSLFSVRSNSVTAFQTGKNNK